MTRRQRRTFSPSFKAKVAIAALKYDAKTSELAKKFDLLDTQVIQWRKQLELKAGDVYLNKSSEEVVDIKTLYAKIGELTLEKETLEKELYN